MELSNIFFGFMDFINIFFLVYLIGYSVFLFSTIIIGSTELYNKRQQDKMKSAFIDDYFIPVSIIVPAYNEELTIKETISSLLALNYRLFEIIIVDDGSKDKTAKKVIDSFSLKKVEKPIYRVIPCMREKLVWEGSKKNIHITLIQKENGGKSDALNMGINASRFPWFVCIDADSVLQTDSLNKIIRPVLENQDVIAVGGVVRPANGVKIEKGKIVSYHMPSNILAAMQVLEYDRSFLASRILFDKFNGSFIISGAFGLFKKSVVISVGGYDRGTLGEDMELVVKLHEYCLSNKIPYSIRYTSDAVCWSQVPEKLSDLKRQRRRWHLGLFQSLYMHKNLFVKPKFGLVGLVSYVYFLIYEFLSPFFETIGIFTVIISYLIGILNLPFMILFFGIYVIFNCVLTMSAFFARVQTSDLRLKLGDVFKAVILCVFEVCLLHLFMTYVRGTAFFNYKKKKHYWGKIQRKKIDFK